MSGIVEQFAAPLEKRLRGEVEKLDAQMTRPRGEPDWQTYQFHLGLKHGFEEARKFLAEAVQTHRKSDEDE